MSSLTESQNEPEINVQLQEGLGNSPILRTFLFPGDRNNWKRFVVLICFGLGVTLSVAGPLLGEVVVPSILRQDAAKAHQITPDDTCYASKDEEQTCDHELKIEYYLFNLTNAAEFVAGSQPPAFQEIGPFVFTAIEKHSNVKYTEDMAKVGIDHKIVQSFVKDESCADCDIAGTVVWIERNDSAGGSLGITDTETAGQRLLALLSPCDHAGVTTTDVQTVEESNLDNVPSCEHHKTMFSGWRNQSLTANVIEYDGQGLKDKQGKDDGRLFGVDFDSDRPPGMFDTWMRQLLDLKTTGETASIRGIKTETLTLALAGMCDGRESPCLHGTWNATSSTEAETIFSLPHFYEADAATFHWHSNGWNPDQAKHAWRFHVEPVHGLTIEKFASYQVSHYLTRSGGFANLWQPEGLAGVWVPTHWVGITYKAPGSDVSTFRSLLASQSAVRYSCTITATIVGGLLVMFSVYHLFFSAEARQRMATVQLLSKSRARDAKLNPAQFDALKQFIGVQTKKFKGRTKTESAGETNRKGKTTSDSNSGGREASALNRDPRP